MSVSVSSASTIPCLSSKSSRPVVTNYMPLSPRKVEQLKKMPKFNSHCHLGGEVPLSWIEKYASAEQMEAIKKAFAGIAGGVDYEKAFFIFPLISQVISTLDRLKEATVATCERMKADNTQLVLMKTGLKSIENTGYEEYLKAVLAGIEQASSSNFSAILMLSVKRFSTQEFAKDTVDLAVKYGVQWIDISDISTKGDISVIMPELLRAKESGIKFAVHMGESPEETDQMLIINQLEPSLIDHGVNLCDEAREWVERNNVPVTVCLTSAIATKMHEKSVLHPWVAMHLDVEHRIHLGTDDSTVFGDITLTSEFVRLYPDVDFERIVYIASQSFEQGRLLF